MQVVVAIMACFALAGCGVVHAVQVGQAKSQLKDAEAACRAQWPTLNKDTAIPRAECVNDAEETILVPVAGNSADLIEQRIAFRRVLASKVASGEISPEDAQLRFAQFNSGLVNQEHTRQVETTEADAAAAQAYSSSVAATAAMVQAAKPTYAPALHIYTPPANTHCYSSGNNTDCMTQ